MYTLLTVLTDFTEETFPEILYLHLDNACNQNKRDAILDYVHY